MTFRIGKNRTLPDWQKWDPSELEKIGPLRIKKMGPSGLANFGPFRIETLPHWQKLGPFRIGKTRTLPDWDPSGFVKIAFPGRLTITSETLPDTVSECIMLNELIEGCILALDPSELKLSCLFEYSP